MSLPAWKIIHTAAAAPGPSAAPAPSRTATFAHGARCVEVASASAPVLLDAIAFLYSDFRAPALPARARPAAQVRIERGRRAAPGLAQRLLLRVGGRPVWRGRGDAEATAALDACVAGHLLPGPAEGLAVLHAACVELPDWGSILLCAPSGGGKTTVAAALLAEGCTLISDDLTPLDPIAFLPHAFPRPIALKPGARPPDCGIEDWMVLPGEAAPLTYVTVTPRLAPGDRGLPLAAIVFVDHAPRNPELLLPLGIAHAASLLAPRIAEAPLGDGEALARDVAAAVPSMILQYADAAVAARSLLRALR